MTLELGGNDAAIMMPDVDVEKVAGGSFWAAFRNNPRRDDAGESGFDIARRMNAADRVPTVIMTARTDLIDRVVGLELGADDHIGKRFELRELLARVRTVLRRAEERSTAGSQEGFRRRPR